LENFAEFIFADDQYLFIFAEFIFADPHKFLPQIISSLKVQRGNLPLEEMIVRCIFSICLFLKNLIEIENFKNRLFYYYYYLRNRD